MSLSDRRRAQLLLKRLLPSFPADIALTLSALLPKKAAGRRPELPDVLAKIWAHPGGISEALDTLNLVNLVCLARAVGLRCNAATGWLVTADRESLLTWLRRESEVIEELMLAD